MSNQINTDLLERAQECIESTHGTTIARVLELNIHMNDLEALEINVARVEALIDQQELEATDIA